MGYLICDKCNSYYELQEGESVNDFTNKCRCGGNLFYSEIFVVIKENLNTCPNCGSENPVYANYCQECGMRTGFQKKGMNYNVNNRIDYAYVIFLERADGSPEGSIFPKFFEYEYNADTDVLLKKALVNNHLTKSEPLIKVKNAKVTEIKKILKKHNLKVSGRKNELIERIITNLTDEEINADFPTSYYVLTDEGRNIVRKNEHIIYYHKAKYLRIIPLEKYHDSLKENEDPNLKYQIALELLERYGLKERKEGNWGLYRNSIHSKAEVYEDMGENTFALKCYFKICILDLSGLNNGNQYWPDLISLAPGITVKIEQLNSKLQMVFDDLQKIYFKSFNDLDLPKTFLPKEQSFEEIIKQINIDTPLDRNLKGIEFEKQGKVDEAIKQYETNISKNVDGNHPYDRLAIIYRKNKQFDDEIRVLEKAVKVFEHVVATTGRGDGPPKLKRFKERLKKAQELKAAYKTNKK
jgi:tetratricopeptide (TPR) repeat protein